MLALKMPNYITTQTNQPVFHQLHPETAMVVRLDIDRGDNAPTKYLNYFKNNKFNFLSKMVTFCQKSSLFSKIEFFVKNRHFCQNLTFLSKIDTFLKN